MHTAAGLPTELLPLALFLLLAALFAIFGAYLLRRPERAATLFADREARHAFRAKDARAIGLVFTIGGVGLLAVGVVRLVLTLTAA
ncbi:hypothetical protein KNO15_05335 [Leifsonia shinshuensis]|uniref:hypothetical protein n=1 Tax=Leifsonia shinshuensis TaxID=150026 RepID=UPI001F5099D3|nr:hypothetical protein [Leifsonia shinshuensis]MCI0156117.1 hypothetical protein [Leifsonia shinshuensis]